MFAYSLTLEKCQGRTLLVRVIVFTDVLILNNENDVCIQDEDNGFVNKYALVVKKIEIDY